MKCSNKMTQNSLFARVRALIWFIMWWYGDAGTLTEGPRRAVSRAGRTGRGGWAGGLLTSRRTRSNRSGPAACTPSCSTSGGPLIALHKRIRWQLLISVHLLKSIGIFIPIRTYSPTSEYFHSFNRYDFIVDRTRAIIKRESCEAVKRPFIF